MFSEKGKLEYGYLLQIYIIFKLKNDFERESYACKEIGIIIEFNIIRCFYTDSYCHAPNPTIKIGTWQPPHAYKVSPLQVCKAFLATKIYPQIKSIKSKIPQQFLYEWISNNLIGTKSKPYVHNANRPINIKLFEDHSIPKSLSFLFRSQHNIRTSKTCYSS